MQLKAPCVDHLQKKAFKIYWDNTLEGETWPQTLLNACCAAIIDKWGEPMSNHYRRCVVRLPPLLCINETAWQRFVPGQGDHGSARVSMCGRAACLSRGPRY